MADAQAEAHVAALLDRMFRDDKKDVTFQLSDGQEFAHEAVLRAASDVFAQMLEHDMKEKSTRTISLSDVSCKVMRVFLRLIYSGSVDKSDWDDAEAPEEHQGVSMLKLHNMSTDGLRLSSTGNKASALLGGGGAGDFAFSVRAETWQGLPAMIGIAPAGSPLTDEMYNTHGFFCQVHNASLHNVYGQDGAGGRALPSQPHLPDGAKVTVKVEGGTLSFAVNDGAFVTAYSKGQIPTGVEYAPAVYLFESGRALEIAGPKAQCPLDVLVGVASLAKKYMAASVFDMCTTALKERVMAAKARMDIGAFQEILASAISVDMGGVRMAALKAAEDFAQLRAEHDAGRLHPEVSQDLQAIWPPAVSTQKLERLS